MGVIQYFFSFPYSPFHGSSSRTAMTGQQRERGRHGQRREAQQWEPQTVLSPTRIRHHHSEQGTARGESTAGAVRPRERTATGARQVVQQTVVGRQKWDKKWTRQARQRGRWDTWEKRRATWWISKASSTSNFNPAADECVTSYAE